MSSCIELRLVEDGAYGPASGRFAGAAKDTPLRLVTSSLAGHCFARLALEEARPEKCRALWLQAIRFFDSCVREDPSNPFLRAHYAMAGAKLAIVDLSFAKPDRFLENEGMKKDFISQFQKCLELCRNCQIDPSADLRIDFAVSLAMMSRPEQALEVLGDLKSNPEKQPRETLALLQCAAELKQNVDIERAELAFNSSSKTASDVFLFASILDLSSEGSKEKIARVVPLVRDALATQPEARASLNDQVLRRLFPASSLLPEFREAIAAPQRNVSAGGS